MLTRISNEFPELHEFLLFIHEKKSCNSENSFEIRVNILDSFLSIKFAYSRYL
jgi:hypothetical protein